MSNYYDYMIFAFGLAILLAGAELFVRSAVKLSSISGKSKLFIGMTVVAFGTGAPELAVAILGVVRGNIGIGIGNIVGSNILNLLFVVGLAALIKPLAVNKGILKRDLPILILISGLFLALTYDRSLALIDSIILGAIMIFYVVFLARQSKSDGNAGIALDEIRTDERLSKQKIIGNISLVVVSILFLTAGSDLAVRKAAIIAAKFGISELTIGLTIVAIGTSLPEIVTSLAAIRRREHDLAIGNIIGSCIFNIAAIPAIMAMVSLTPITISKHVVIFDLPLMITAAAVCYPLFFSGRLISRLEGLLLLAFYAVYVVLLLNNADELPLFSNSIAFVSVIALPMILLASMSIIFQKLSDKSVIQNTGDHR